MLQEIHTNMASLRLPENQRSHLNYENCKEFNVHISGTITECPQSKQDADLTLSGRR